MAYADVEIRIFGRVPTKEDVREVARYPVELTVNSELEFPRGYLDPGAQPATPTKAGYADEEYGEALFRWLFSDRILSNAWADIRGAYPQRRVRLRIDADEPELHRAVWEALRDPGDGRLPLGLATTDVTPFSRYLALPSLPGRPVFSRPIRILVVAPAQKNFRKEYPADQNPDLEEINPAAELKSLTTALQELIDRGVVAPPKLLEQPCSLSRIMDELRRGNGGKGYHVLHLVCHGSFNPDQQRSRLCLATNDNLVGFSTDEEFAIRLHELLGDATVQDENRLRLVFLASCESATRSSADAFRGVAPQLVKAGVPAVVAMQDQVGEQTAREFATVFYRQLLEDGQVDLAANVARANITARHLAGPVIPVLFLRLPDGQLLGPDPVVAALQRLKADPDYRFFDEDQPDYVDLPAEAIHLTSKQDFRSFDPAETEQTAGLNVRKAMKELLAPAADNSASRLLVLLGEYGSNITTQLKRTVWITAQEWSEPGAEKLLPVYVDLAKFSEWRTTARDPILELIVRGLVPKYWPKEAEAALERQIQRDSVKLRVLFDHSGKLTQEQRQEAHRQMAAFVCKHPRHQYVLAARPGTFDRQSFEDAGVKLDILLMQRMERRKIRRFLQMPALQKSPWRDPRGKPVGSELLLSLDRSGFYDLAGIPWVLKTLLMRAQVGVYPRSRTKVLHEIIELAVEQITEKMSGDDAAQGTAAQGMAYQVKQSLRALAWKMQDGLQATLPLNEAYAILRRVRGDREYSLEQLFWALVDAKLLASQGRDAMRFAYGLIQSYCCARAILSDDEWERKLDNIVSSLGRPRRLRWWEDTLVFACGMLAEDPDKAEHLDSFVESIIYSMNLLDSAQLFLAARCLSEADCQGAGARKGQARDPGSTARSRRPGGALWDLTKTVTTALIARLDNRNEPRACHRSQAALLLGQIADPIGVKHLAQVAYGQPFRDRRGQPDFDRSDVRMAAMVGLLRMKPAKRRRLLRDIDPVLVDLLDGWQRGRVESLITSLRQEGNVSLQGLAALALGDIYMQLQSFGAENKKAQQARDELAKTFLSCDVAAATRWAVAYAIALMDLPTVQKYVILPFFEQEKTMYPKGEKCTACYKCMAYLIGLVRWQDQRGRDYLLNRCMKEADDPVLAVAAIGSLGRLSDQEYKVPLEEVALGDFDRPLPKLAARIKMAESGPNHPDKIYVRRKAIEALASIGDAGTVDRLRSNRTDPDSWNPELEQALYQTSEEIYWRSHWERPL